MDRWLVVVCAFICLSTGCSPYQLAKRTLHTELAQFPRVTEGRLACKQYRIWAVAEWDAVLAESSGVAYSTDYGDGFLQGFVDQVYAGGSVRVPSMPPRKYWRMAYRNEAGKQSVSDWYAGFEHGARVAKDKGYRERAEIPSSLWLDAEYGQGELVSIDEGYPFEGESDSQDQNESYEILPPGIEPLEHEPTPADPAEDASSAVSRATPQESVAAAPVNQAVSETPAAASNESATGATASSAGLASESKPTRTAAARKDVSLANFEVDASALPAETRQDLPPKPPWLAEDQAAQTTIANGSANRDSNDAGVSGFDPFQGTLFESMSEVPVGPPSEMEGDLPAASLATTSDAAASAGRSGPKRPDLPTIPIDAAASSPPTHGDQNAVFVASPSPANGWEVPTKTDVSEGLPLLDVSSPQRQIPAAATAESSSEAIESLTTGPVKLNGKETDLSQEASAAKKATSELPAGWQVKPTAPKTEWKSKRTSSP